jgi:hypothetical protein
MNYIIGKAVRTKYRHIISIMLGLVGVVLLGGCAADSTDASQQSVSRNQRDIYLSPYSQAYPDVTPVLSHRALPDNYVVYDELSPIMDIENTKIHCFLTHGRSVDFQGDFIYNGSSSWFSKVPLDEGDYYVYGFMPSVEKASVTTLNPENENKLYSHGAVITFSNMNAVSNSDICVIVGVLGAQDNKTSIAEKDMTLGCFGYNAGTDGDHIYLLMDHLYAALQFNMTINSNYRQLRRIKLTKMELKATSNKVNVVATLTPNETGTSPLAISQSQTEVAGDWVTIYEGDEQEPEQELDVSIPCKYAVFAAPGSANKTFNLKTNYNVYDRQNNLIGKRTAENKLTLSFADTEKTALVAGEKYTFNLTVNPTYLYVLSDPDLDNPTVTVN